MGGFVKKKNISAAKRKKSLSKWKNWGAVYPLKDTDGFEDVEFYGFCGDFEENKDRLKLEIEEETTGHKEVIESPI